jgi:hypothetical protein
MFRRRLCRQRTIWHRPTWSNEAANDANHNEVRGDSIHKWSKPSDLWLTEIQVRRPVWPVPRHREGVVRQKWSEFCCAV